MVGLLWVSCGCGGGESSGTPRKETFPVVGKVLVDGEAVENLAVYCESMTEIDKENPTKSQSFTLKDGSFKIGTYLSTDGVPEGEYALTFQWGEMNGFTRVYEGDKLNGRYSNPKTSAVKFTVEPGEPTDLGTIELTTK
jgi:hypothetical protein